jgi:hypothetical protein
MKNLDDWTRLARAAPDARDDLRSLVPALDRAIGEKNPTIPLLETARDVAIHHAEALRLALKPPAAREGGSGAKRPARARAT